MMHVYSAPLLTWIFLAGAGIAVLGAPAPVDARPTISEVLHNEYGVRRAAVCGSRRPAVAELVL